MKKILTLMIAVIFLCQLFCFPRVFALEERDIIAKSAILMDKATGRVLWEKNSELQMAMASTTKIMTCIIVLENASLDQEVVVSHRAEIAPKVKLYLKEGETYRLGDLLYALMLQSSNDAAVAIAEGVSGSVEDFCALMTEKAKSLGAINTSFKTPNGLDAEGHFTTAYDLALISRYALNNERFNEIINTRSHSFLDGEKQRSFTVNNKNAFLNLYEGANGVKTGFTGDAGYCFVGSVKQGDMELIAVVLASGWPPNKTFRWRDTIALMDYGYDHFKYESVQIDRKIVAHMDQLKYAKVDEVQGILSCNVKMILRDDEAIHIIYNIESITEAPILKDQIIGEANIYINDQLYTSFDIKATKTIERIDLKYCIEYIVSKFTAF